MAGSVNKVILVGNLGRDPEVRNFQNGGKVVNLRIATSERYKDREGNQQDAMPLFRKVASTDRLMREVAISLHILGNENNRGQRREHP